MNCIDTHMTNTQRRVDSHKMTGMKCLLKHACVIQKVKMESEY